jgi:hypothetical protein
MGKNNGISVLMEGALIAGFLICLKITKKYVKG